MAEVGNEEGQMGGKEGEGMGFMETGPEGMRWGSRATGLRHPHSAAASEGFKPCLSNSDTGKSREDLCHCTFN